MIVFGSSLETSSRLSLVVTTRVCSGVFVAVVSQLASALNQHILVGIPKKLAIISSNRLYLMELR